MELTISATNVLNLKFVCEKQILRCAKDDRKKSKSRSFTSDDNNFVLSDNTVE